MHSKTKEEEKKGKVVFVVHRYYPYPGGSENYVRWMAEEMLSRNYDVTVFAETHRGDMNGVRVTDNGNIFVNEKFDLVIVHGADVAAQNWVLSVADRIQSPVLYMIILPSGSSASLDGMKKSDYVSWSTAEDFDYICKHGHVNKSVNVRHGIKLNPDNILEANVRDNTREKYGIKDQDILLLSCGGYWSNKAMRELASLVEGVDRSNIKLITTGYGGDLSYMPLPSDKVIPLLVEDHDEVHRLMRAADLYIMHSHVEGFGLVLLEASLRFLPWAARHMAGAARIVHANGKKYPLGFTYTSDDELKEYIKNFYPRTDVLNRQVANAYMYVSENHLIKDTVDDIITVIEKEKKNGDQQ